MRIAHSLDSWLLYVHPPLAMIGYILTFTLLFTLVRYRKDDSYGKIVGRVGWSAWTLNFLGLVTGMIWAQAAWGRPFAFDPKETMTLLLFLSVGLNMYLFHRKAVRSWLVANGVASCVLIFLTVLIPLFIESLHGYA